MNQRDPQDLDGELKDEDALAVAADAAPHHCPDVELSSVLLGELHTRGVVVALCSCEETQVVLTRLTPTRKFSKS